MPNIGDLVRIKYTMNTYDSVGEGRIAKPSVLFRVNHLGVVLSHMTDPRPRTPPLDPSHVDYTQVLLPTGVGWVWSGDIEGV